MIDFLKFWRHTMVICILVKLFLLMEERSPLWAVSAITELPDSSISKHAQRRLVGSVPSLIPSTAPSRTPSFFPTGRPSRRPSSQPSRRPSTHPSEQPSVQPSIQPSGRPSTQPSCQPSKQVTHHTPLTFHIPSNTTSDIPSSISQPTARQFSIQTLVHGFPRGNHPYAQHNNLPDNPVHSLRNRQDSHLVNQQLNLLDNL